MLTRTLLAFTTVGAEWVLWLLVLLSVVSVGVMIERALFFARRRLPDPDELSRLLLGGDLAGARAAVQGREGMEAIDETGRVRSVAVLRDPGHGLGPAAARIARRYFRFRPARLGGEPVATEIPFTVLFELP